MKKNVCSSKLDLDIGFFFFLLNYDYTEIFGVFLITCREVSQKCMHIMIKMSNDLKCQVDIICIWILGTSILYSREVYLVICGCANIIKKLN